jgi:ectoine hydroxylase-related dioxygenase (phytanoyl-CoA dioxygenase family)
MWCLTDFTAQNGATVVVPFSHHTRHSPTASRTAYSQECSVVAPAGSAILFQPGTWHRQGANTLAYAHRVAASFGYTPTYWRRREGMWPDVERAVAATMSEQAQHQSWSRAALSPLAAVGAATRTRGRRTNAWALLNLWPKYSKDRYIILFCYALCDKHR